ncbi:MAG: methyltransferase domain-containing protein [Candidatus Omnitrophica bacterium]|nr:methyltransferase domain-containing protein [Candidatus Omnitrophota bacterium]
MLTFLHKLRRHAPVRVLTVFVLMSFIGVGVTPTPVVAGESIFAPMPRPGTMVSTTERFVPTLLKGIMINPTEPFQLDFIVDTGHRSRRDEGLEEEKIRLIKYFMAALTVPEDDLWVNLSPFEQQRIIPEKFGYTDMGRDLLAQDYLLKQLTATLMYPEKELGHNFWDRIYKQAQARFGTTDIPVNTFNKVWIIPEEAVIYEQGNAAYIVNTRLKVMLEEDYIALDKNLAQRTQAVPAEKDESEVNSLASEVIREVILPAIEEEVNYGKNFATLRQIYHSLILAAWYKESIKTSLINQLYSDQNKVNGIDIDDKEVKDRIYRQYIEAFQEGVYSYIREEFDPVTQEVIPRKYFSGGVRFRMSIREGVISRTSDAAVLSAPVGDTEVVQVGLLNTNRRRRDQAVLATRTQDLRADQVRPEEFAAVVDEYLEQLSQSGETSSFDRGQWLRGRGPRGNENSLMVLRTRDGNRIVGLASHRIGQIPSVDADLVGQRSYIVDYIEVAPEYRSTGYGKILLSEVMRTSLTDSAWDADAETANPGELVLNPADAEAERYFSQQGFREIPRDTSEDFVYDSPSLLQAQRFFRLSGQAARTLYRDGQALKAQPEDAERWARIAPIYEAQGTEAAPGEQLGLFPDGIDDAASGEAGVDRAVLSRPNWERFVPRGIDANPAWRRDPAYSDFSNRMGSNATVDQSLGSFMDLLREESIPLPGSFRRGAILGFGESAAELISVRSAFNLQEVHGVEWVGDRVQTAAEALAQSNMFPNQISLHHANMADLGREFGPGTFDFVYAAMISDTHDNAPVAIAREINRILQPGGYAFINEGNSDFIAYLEKRGTLTRWAGSNVSIFRKAGVLPDQLEKTAGLNADQRRVLTELANFDAISKELGRAVANEPAVAELLAQSNLFSDDLLVSRSAGYRPTDSIGLFGYDELPGLIGGMRLRTENQFYFKALQQHAPQIVAYARALLDNPEYAGKKFVALGRGADLIYDAMVALTYLDARYADRRGDLTIIDFSSENVTELGTDENIDAYGEMFLRQISRQLNLSSFENLVFINEVASESNTTRALLDRFLDTPFEYTAGVIYDNIETRSGTRWDGSNDTSAFDWLDSDYRSGRTYQIQSFPLFGLGHQYGVTPFQRFLNQEAVYSEVYRQSAGLTTVGASADRAVLAVTDAEFDGLQSTLEILQTIAGQLDTFVTNRGLREYRQELERWNRDAVAALAEAERTGTVPANLEELARRMMALNESTPKAAADALKTYSTGESSFLQIFAGRTFSFFNEGGDALQERNSEYAVYDYIDKLNKALSSAIFAGDMFIEDLAGDPLENLRMAQSFAERGVRDLDNYFNLLRDTLDPSGINVVDFEMGLEKDAFPQAAYGEFLLPYAQVLAARRQGRLDNAILVGNDLRQTADFLGADTDLVREAFLASIDQESALKRLSVGLDIEPAVVLTRLIETGLARRNEQRGELGFDLTTAFFAADENTVLIISGQDRFAEMSRSILEELREDRFAAELAARGIDLGAAPLATRLAEQAATEEGLPTVLELVRLSGQRQEQRADAAPLVTESTPSRPQLAPDLLAAYDSYVDLLGNVLAELQNRRAGDQVWFIFDHQYWDNLPANSMARDQRNGDFLIHLHTSEGDLTRGFLFRINPDADEGEPIFDKFWIEDTSSQGFVDGQRFVDAGYITADFARQLLEDATAVMRQDDGFPIMDRYAQMRKDFYPLMQDVINKRPEKALFVVGAVQDARGQDVLINIFRKRDVAKADADGTLPRSFSGPSNASYPVAYKVTADQAVLGANPVGGIDLTPNNLNIDVRRDPNGVPVPLTPQQIQDVNINGLYPVIINTVPVTSVPLLLGIADRPDASTDLSQAPPAVPANTVPAAPDLLSLLR